MASIEDRIGSSTAVTFNSNELRADTQIYLSQFNSENWSGDIIAFDFLSDGSISTTPAWNVADQYDDVSYDYNTRVVYTLNTDTNTGTLLDWANITTAQQNDFKTNPDGSLGDDAIGQARLEYILGDRTNEASGSTYDFRSRESLLGDIIHSGPEFVGKPSLPYPDGDPFGVIGNRYSDFAESQKNRDGIIYVGSNDGMLHAFDTTQGGNEIMTYVPAELYSSGTATEGLHYLTNPDYQHKYYVDATVTTSDIFANLSSGAFGSDKWYTVLIGSYRAGGRGIYALDITDPTFGNNVTSAAQTVLWEFSDDDTPYMGYSFSEPSVVLLNNNKWAAVFGNGYNSDNGKAALLIVYIEEGVDGTWAATDFEVIDTNTGTVADKNGLGQITAVDTNGDFKIDRVYGGDIKGNLWAFDLSDTNSSNWDVAYPSDKPLFISQSDQAITVKGTITRTAANTSSNSPNILVIFGTGQFLVSADPSDTDTQSLYGVWDAGESEIEITDLVEQVLLPDSTNLLRIMSDNPVNYNESNPSSGDLGWYFNLPTAGERLLVNPVIRAEQVFFATSIPNTAICADGGGSGWLMILDAENGGEPTAGSFDINNDGYVDSSDQISSRFAAGIKFNNGLPGGLGFLGNSNNLYISGTGSSTVGAEGIVGLNQIDASRISWKELIK